MILPTSSLLTRWPPTNQSRLCPQVSENLDRFSKLHHRRYVLVTAPLMGSHELAAFTLLQEKFLTDDMQFLPMHNSQECVSSMTTIARAMHKPVSALINSRMSTLLESQLVSEETVMSILSGCGLTPSECMMLMDGCGGLSGVAQASEQELVDLNLNRKTVKKIMDLMQTTQ